MDFDPTGSYFAVGLDVSAVAGKHELLIFHVGEDLSITLTNSLDIGLVVVNVSWHPDGEVIAAGLEGSTENLRLYSFKVYNGTLTEVEQVTTGSTNDVFFVNWKHDGSRLLVGRIASGSIEDLFVYEYDASTYNLTSVYEEDLSSNVCVRYSHDDEYFAVGTRGDEIYVYSTKKFFYIDDAFIFLNGTVHLNLPLKISGNCFINGRGNELALDSNGEISVYSGGRLVFENVFITGLNGNNIRCRNNDASITLRNSNLVLNHDFTFGTGSILFEKDVVVSGTNKFSYTSTMASTIASHSTLFLDYDVTFSYAPASSSKDLLEMVDKTSRLNLKGCTVHATTTGLQLTKGTLEIGSKSYLSSEATNEFEGVIFGDGTSDNNLYYGSFPASYLEVLSGYLVNNNVE